MRKSGEIARKSEKQKKLEKAKSFKVVGELTSNAKSIDMTFHNSSEPTKDFTLIDFVKLALKEDFSDNIKIISLSRTNPKEFTIVLK